MERLNIIYPVIFGIMLKPPDFIFQLSLKGGEGTRYICSIAQKRWWQFKKLAEKLKSQRVYLFLRSYIGVFTSEALNYR